MSAPFFRLSDGAVLDARTFLGKGGDIIINTNIAEILNGGQLLSTAEFGGRAGKITVNAAKQIMIVGSDSTFSARTTIIKGLGEFFSPSSGIFVRSQNDGIAGDIEINTLRLTLDNQARLNAESATGNGGNITLNISDLLLIRRGSQISTNAGTAQVGGNGGNITINAPKGFIVGVKSENSDITANAFTGSGGRVNITTQGIYGLQFRPQLTEFSDITASSTFGVSGVVSLNTLGIDPSRGLQQLPVSLIDPSNRIDQKCAAGSAFRRSSFTVTGRGGLPENPLDPLQSGEGMASWVEVDAANTDSSKPSSQNSLAPLPAYSSTPTHLIEADSLMVGKDGSVQLVASQSIAAPGGSWHLPTCSSLK